MHLQSMYIIYFLILFYKLDMWLLNSSIYQSSVRDLNGPSSYLFFSLGLGQSKVLVLRFGPNMNTKVAFNTTYIITLALWNRMDWTGKKQFWIVSINHSQDDIILDNHFHNTKAHSLKENGTNQETEHKIIP